MDLNYFRLGRFGKLMYHTKKFFVQLPRRIVRIIAGIGRAIGRFFIGIGHGLASIWSLFVTGDVFVKLSFLVMGLGLVVKKQFIRGFAYLVAQVGFICFFIMFGWQYLSKIGTLGEAEQTITGYTASGLPLYSKPDNSMLILLYGVMFIMLACAFLALWVRNIKSCHNAMMAAREGRRLPTLRESFTMLLNEKYHITLLSVPTILIIIFTILPLCFMVLIAFTNFDAKHQPPGNLFSWVGFQNFTDILGGNETKAYTFKYLLQWTVVWAICATVSNYILGMILAIMINKKGIRLKKMWRTFFVTTIAVPQFVSLLLMSRLFGDQGTVNMILQQIFNFETYVPFLSKGSNARIMVILINIWVGIPYTMLTTTGILMNIPKDLYESARIDGASTLKTFTKITLPYILFVTTPYLITTFIGNFNNFNVIFLLTGGDPKSLNLFQAGETDLLVTWLYKLTVQYQDYNLASVIGILVFLVSATLSLIVYNMSGSMKNEEAFR